MNLSAQKKKEREKEHEEKRSNGEWQINAYCC